MASYYIRAKGDPTVYWASNQDGTIVASRARSTRFTIRTVDKALQNQVMIGSDLIQISVRGRAVGFSHKGQLEVNGHGDRLTFGDLENGFGLEGEAIVQDSDGGGEPWEPVLEGRISLPTGKELEIAQ